MNTPASESASPASRLDRDDMLLRWRDGRAFTRVLFDQLLPEDAWFDNPIPVRHPFVFYEGHLAAFVVNTLVKGALGRPGVDAMLERLFERGIDPKDEGEGATFAWPTRARVLDYVRRAEAAIEDAITTIVRDAPREPQPERNEALHAIVEHELMHQETLLYMLRELPTAAKRRPADLEALQVGGTPPPRRRVAIPAGRATLGLDRESGTFAWDNEFPRIVSDVAGFEIDVFPVTNADFLEFVDAGGYREASFWNASDFAWIRREGITHPHAWLKRGKRWWCRAQFEEVPLPPAWPVWVSRAEAEAYARFRGRRLPTEAEWHRAAFGRPDGRENAFPWGEGRRGRAPRQLRRGPFRPGARGFLPVGRERVRRAGPRGKRMGVDGVAVPAVPGLPSHGVVSAILGGLLRRRPRRAEGGVSRDGRASREAQLPQLVPDAVSVRLREVPHGRRVSFASDVRRGLGTRPYRLPPHWFYDELGSRLFDAICLLPWYRITRAERRLLRRAARAMARGAPRPAFVAELGPGNGEKLTLFLEDLGGAPRVLLVDISPEALAASTARLAKAGFGRVATVRGTYEAGLARIARERPKRGRALVLFLGSNVGNFEPPRAARFLRDVRSALEPGDGLLLGADLVKPEEGSPPRLRRPARRDGRVQPQRSRAHEPRAGGGHRPDVLRAPGRLERGEGRMEMFLVSRVAQTVRIPGARLEVPFRKGESIFTEASYKYVSGDLRARVEAAGFVARRHFEDRGRRVRAHALHGRATGPAERLRGYAPASCVSG